MIRDSRPTVLLTQATVADRLAAPDGPAVVMLDQEPLDRGSFPGTPEEPVAGGPAYLIYTSGSAGQPKGVLLGRAALANLIAWQGNASRAGPGWRTLQFTPLSFDVHFQEFFGTWATGGTLVLTDEETRRDPAALLDLIATEQISRLFLPFAALQSLAETGCQREQFPGCLREVITAGEQLQITPDLRRFFSRLPGCTLHNHYGPSETHVVTAHTLAGDPASWPTLPPIGRPLPGVELQVVGERGERVEPPQSGELYIGGVALADGYHGRPDLTAERFVRRDGRRFYRSGDRVREREGVYEFLGRVDSQVKIRGHRAEPGEVEAVLRDHPAVKLGAVVAQSDPIRGNRLVGYWVPRTGLAHAAAAVRRHLRERLPDYLVPAELVQVDALPMTPSGKVDRSALRPPAAGVSPRPATAPRFRDPEEEGLAGIWSEMLGGPLVQSGDDFFQLGGDSLLAARVVLRVEQTFGVRLPVAALYRHPTLEGLAAVIRACALRKVGGNGPEPTSCLIPVQTAGSGPPLFWVPGADCEPSILLGRSSFLSGLARRIGADQPLFNLCFTYGTCGPAQVTIEHIAGAFLQDVRALRPEGPYLLAGWSFGGLVAFEMAQQLRAAGQAVKLLALFDTTGPGYPARRGWAGRVLAAWRAWRACRGLARLTDPLVGLRRAIRQACVPVRRWLGRRAGVRNPWEHVMRMEAAYLSRLPPYAGEITLFPTTETLAATARDSSLIPDPALGWQALADRVELHPISGDHHSMFDEPGMSAIVEVLRAKLGAAQVG
jgi:amino acid adenylation domain-containing protein